MIVTEEPEPITPSLRPVKIALPESPNVSPKDYRPRHASLSGKKMTGRPSVNASTSSLQSVTGQFSELKFEHTAFQDQGESLEKTTDNGSDSATVLQQVVAWLNEEKSKMNVHTSKHHLHRRHHLDQRQSSDISENLEQHFTSQSRPRSNSQASEVALALDRLERILRNHASTGKEGLAKLGLGRRGSSHKTSSQSHRRQSLVKKLKRHQSGSASDTDYFQEGDTHVPTVEAVLDNSKTLAYTSVTADDAACAEIMSRSKHHWVAFKQEIVRLTHTLQLKGWRRIPIDSGGNIDVERLSGALTNAVYVVSPPKSFLSHVIPPQSNLDAEKEHSLPKIPRLRRPPPKLLLRIYGPQVSHLIDREAELAILCRLARKRIGPRLLGTFSNGRFEEFFHAKTLTAADLRIPETSVQIAKRMRELHDGIALLPEERADGPFVWANWHKWVNRCEMVVKHLDRHLVSTSPSKSTASLTSANPYSQTLARGPITGTLWPFFRATVEKYISHLTAYYASPPVSTSGSALHDSLVFAHNDTQYGNLLRLQPVGPTSPLLSPLNQHKRLVVIDFEYANANTRGLEFANHFTEWCYDYHDAEAPWRCDAGRYPTRREQRAFLRAYVKHRPEVVATPGNTPSIRAREREGLWTPGSTPSYFGVRGDGGMKKEGSLGGLGGRAMAELKLPGGALDNEEGDDEEDGEEKDVEAEVWNLMHETRLWRVANSAQWVAWGVVQAKVAGLDDEKLENAGKQEGQDEAVTATTENNKEDDPQRQRCPTSVTQASVDWQADFGAGSHGYGYRSASTLLGQSNDQEVQDVGPEETGAAPEMDHKASTAGEHPPTQADTDVNEREEEEEAQEEGEGFDYLAYAQERALLFWGDVLALGVVGEAEVKEQMQMQSGGGWGLWERVKRVDG